MLCIITLINMIFVLTSYLLVYNYNYDPWYAKLKDTAESALRMYVLIVDTYFRNADSAHFRAKLFRLVCSVNEFAS